MVNVGKLVGATSAEYYLEKVARGVEDYYLHAGEAPGMWHGKAAVELGLAGEVMAEELMALLRGEHPLSGERLAQPQRGSDRVWGFDVTFRAPKSVSLLFALSEGTVPREVRSAHETALETALGYLEREAGFGRRRLDGTIQPVATSGFVAAAFQHRTSRAGDPLLHTHVLVANLVRGSDGRWGALDGRRLYAHAKAVGVLYQAELRTELTRRLGVAWTPVHNGLAEVEGVPQEVIRAFSRRRQEITEHMRARGDTSARAAQVATLETRRGKDRDISADGLPPEWRSRAAALGLGPQATADVLGRSGASAPDGLIADEAIQMLLGPEGLTAYASTFTRRDVLVAAADRLGPGVAADSLEQITDALLTHAHVVTLTDADASQRRAAVLQREDGRLVPGPDDRRFTTYELLDLERQLIDQAVTRRGRARETVTAAAFEAALTARPSLSDEQVAMCRQLLTSADGIQVVRGHAGTGKTYALDACRDAWEGSGMRVVGCALSARAAAELQAGAGIVSSTLHRLLVELDTEDRRPRLVFGWQRPEIRHLVDLDRHSVVVVDEAGMVGTRQLAALLNRAARAGARVVLVGDDRQLPEIDAGGAFRSLADRLGAVELTDNRRQESAWERDALGLLREGHVEAALDAYAVQGRVVTGDTAEEVRSRMVADWWAAQHGGGVDAVMIALRRADVRELNGRARALRIAAGEVVGLELPVPGGSVGVGDRMMTKRNDRRLGVRNGDRGTVTAVDVEAGCIDVRIEGDRHDPRTVRLPRKYIEAGHLTLAYALTAHSAQGMTADRAFVLGDDAAYLEWGYSALSRGREENRLYVVAGAREGDDAGHRRPSYIAVALDAFTDALRRTRSQSLATDRGDALAPQAEPERARLRTLTDAELVAELKRATRGELPDWPKPEDPGDHAIRRAERIEQERRDHFEATQRRVEKRAEILASEGWLSRWRRGEERRIDERILRSDEASLPQLQERWSAATAEVARLHGEREAGARWEAEREALEREGLRRGLAIRDELQVRERNRGREQASAMARLESNPPAYVVAALGERPDGAGAQRAWREAAAALEAHRDRYGVTDGQRPLGSAPVVGRDNEIARLIHRTRSVIAATPQSVRAPAATTGLGECTELDNLIAVVRQRDTEQAAERSRRRRLEYESDAHRHYDHHHYRSPDRSQGRSVGM